MEGEDQLVALGLEQFTRSICSSSKEQKVFQSLAKMISKRLVVSKHPEQIMKRVRNQKRRKADDESNPIVYFYKHNKAPKIRLDYDCFMHVNPPDLPLKASPPESLPTLWRVFFNLPAPVKKTFEPELAVDPDPAPERQVEMIFRYSPQHQSIAFSEQRDMPVLSKESFSDQSTSIAPRKRGLLKVAQKSPLKKERERILKKYSPIKIRQQKEQRRRLILPKPSTAKTGPTYILPKTASSSDTLAMKEQALLDTNEESAGSSSIRTNNMLEYAVAQSGVSDPEMPKPSLGSEEVMTSLEECNLDARYFESSKKLCLYIHIFCFNLWKTPLILCIVVKLTAQTLTPAPKKLQRRSG